MNTTIRPSQIIKESFDALKGAYWPIVGITAVGILVASLVPMAILYGPMMCGIYLIYLDKLENKPFMLADMFNKGFQHFAEALIAILIQMGIIFVPVLFLIIIVAVAAIFFGNQHLSQKNDPAFIIFMIIFYIGALLVIFAASVPFIFVYPLIADKKMKAWPATKLSAKTAMDHLGALLGMELILVIMTFAGALCCYVGVFFVLPVAFMAKTIAYKKIFKDAGAISSI
ncbi:hypothetical protein K1X76_12175 [bacterium]|nr:hypothetical protein [bacterium]